MNDGQFVAGYHALARLLVADADTSSDIDQRYVALYGDLQPANFLAVRSGPGAAEWTLSGFLDYEGGAFRDLLLGLAKYKTHDLHPLNKAGAVEAWLSANDVSAQTFARCLPHPQNPRFPFVISKMIWICHGHNRNEGSDERCHTHVYCVLYGTGAWLCGAYEP